MAPDLGSGITQVRILHERPGEHFVPFSINKIMEFWDKCMPRKQKKYHFIYRTTNLLNHKFYVGMHSTDNLEDGYIGSGKRLGYSVRKYGLENHKFEILEFLPSREELKKREAEVVNEEMLKHPLCMNLKFGGEGGWDHVNTGEKWHGVGNLKNREIFEKTRQSQKRRYAVDKEYQARVNEQCLRMNKKSLANNPNGTFFGKRHTEETKQKMRKSKNLGETNSQFGTCWICNRDEVKKIKKEELQFWLDQGWNKGRKFNAVVAEID